MQLSVPAHATKCRQLYECGYIVLVAAVRSVNSPQKNGVVRKVCVDVMLKLCGAIANVE